MGEELGGAYGREVVHGEVCDRDMQVLCRSVRESHDVVGGRDDLGGGGQVHLRQNREEQDVVDVVDETSPAILDEVVAVEDVDEREHQSRTDHGVAHP